MKILIINPFGIGDVLFTTPVIARLKEKYPEGSITYWCNERVKGLFRSIPNVNQVIAFSRGDLKRLWGVSKLQAIKRFLKLLRTIKNAKFDLVFDYSLDHRYGIVTKLAGIPRRIGFDYRRRGRFLTDAQKMDGYQERHIVEYYLGLLNFIGTPYASGREQLLISQSAKIRSRIILESCGVKGNDLIIGIAPGAGGSWGKDARLKHWPANRFAQLADRMIDAWGAKVVLVGDKSEQTIAEEVGLAMKREPIDLTGKTPLEELPALISNFDLLVANDGGLLHIGVAVDTPTVSIFGPVSDKVYGPYPPAHKHRVVKNIVPCQPCYVKFRMPDCPNERECITGISSDCVFQAAGLVLEEGGKINNAKDTKL